MSNYAIQLPYANTHACTKYLSTPPFFWAELPLRSLVYRTFFLVALYFFLLLP